MNILRDMTGLVLFLMLLCFTLMSAREPFARHESIAPPGSPVGR